jgi:hypothetical protein
MAYTKEPRPGDSWTPVEKNAQVIAEFGFDHGQFDAATFDNTAAVLADPWTKDPLPSDPWTKDPRPTS